MNHEWKQMFEAKPKPKYYKRNIIIGSLNRTEQTPLLQEDISTINENQTEINQEHKCCLPCIIL
ncbi:hypothetical protein [Spiroplasma endosymbiont of Aleiodes alternator]|uniref:hypothetical protein n=1 Tax=Spiroplasma endosymbiont of Aleiodes alternator TaxID=3139329 RepID=UPI003CCAF415